MSPRRDRDDDDFLDGCDLHDAPPLPDREIPWLILFARRAVALEVDELRDRRQEWIDRYGS